MSQVRAKLMKIIALTLALLFICYYIFPSSSSNHQIVTLDDTSSKNSIPTPKNDKKQKKKKTTKKVKATFVTLARNEDLWELLGSIQSLEDRFNHKYAYDWVFLNDVPFTDEFVQETTKSVSGKTKYGFIPYEHWSVPISINTKKFAAAREKMREENVIYGDSISYRHMCRYESGFFYKHPLLDDYDYYWRVEPSVKFFCDIDYDVFQFMQDEDKEYGFALALREYESTIPTLWETTKAFLEKYPKFIADDNALEFISDDNGESYNLCHFWSNFEIGKLDFLRGKAYNSYFNYLDKAGGFFYERWGDAPVHTIAASLFLNKNKIHFFDDIGYYHGPYTQCPIKEDVRIKGRCSCNPRDDFTYESGSCMAQYGKMKNLPVPTELAKYTL